MALYELSGGDALNWASHSDIGAQAGLPQGDVFTVGQFVSGQHLAEFKTGGGPDGLVAITTYGIERAEEIISAREEAGEPRYSGIVVLTDAQLAQTLEPLLAKIRLELENDTDLDPETQADVRADLDSANDQLRAARPNRGVIKASFDRIKSAWPTIAGVAGVAASITEVVRGLGV